MFRRIQARAGASARSGQTLAEYSVLVWFFTFFGVATLATFIFALEESLVGQYQDIVNTICLPIP